MIKKLVGVLDYFTPNDIEASSYLDRLRIRFQISVIVLGGFTGIISSVLEGFKLGFFSPLGLVNIFWISCFFGSLLIIKNGKRLIYSQWLMVSSVITAVFFTASQLEGLNDPVLTWLNFAPLLAVLMADRKFAIWVTIFIFFEMAVFLYFYDYSGDISKVTSLEIKLFGILTPILFSGIFSFAFSFVIELTQKQLLDVQKELMEEKQILMKEETPK